MDFADNIEYLLKFIGLNQRDLADYIGMADSTISRIKRTNKANKHTLKRIAKAIAEKSTIPYDFFEDGQALLTKNFTEYNLRQNTLTPQNSLPTKEERGETVNINSFGQKLTALYNEDLGIMNSENYIPIPPDLLNTLLEFFAISHFNKELFLSFIRWGRTLGRSGHDKNGGY